jgi:hypothetical protein
MKKELLLVFSIICIVAALAIAVAVPIIAGQNGASINKLTVYNGDGTATSTIKVTNNNASATITITKIWDVVYHKDAVVETSPDLALPSGDLAAGSSYSVDFTYTLHAADYGQTVQDACYVEGLNNANDPPINKFALSYPDQHLMPVPELAAGILFGLGALGLGGFILIRRKQAAKA